MRINDVIIKPKITEKALANAKNSVYTFEVHTNSNKNQIKEAVETIFKVVVSNVKTVSKKGKEKRVGRTMRTIQRPDRKIALVKVKEGKIDIFPKA
jgi:large subunit ribosomal protein L23